MPNDCSPFDSDPVHLLAIFNSAHAVNDVAEAMLRLPLANSLLVCISTDV